MFSAQVQITTKVQTQRTSLNIANHNVPPLSIATMAPNSHASSHLPQLVAKLTQLISTKVDDSSIGLNSREERDEFVNLTELLRAAALDPAENVYYLACRTAQNSAIRCALALEIFTVVGENGSTAKEIAAACNADELLIERMMRALVSCSIFDQRAEGLNKIDDKESTVTAARFVHNVQSSCFLQPSNRDMFQQMHEFVGKGVYSMADYLQATGWKNPEGYQDAPISAVLGLTEKSGGFWEYLAASQERQRLFNGGMASRTSSNHVAALYPFDLELNQPPIQDDEVALVDVGGGRGHALQEIHEAHPNLPGRLILQDQQTVIEDAKRTGCLSTKIEAQVASFFDPNPVHGARAYYFRRIFHDWSDPIAVRILSNSVNAMGPYSRVLIADIEVPETGAPWSMALQDWNMMAIGGIERTEIQWHVLLRKAGLQLVKTWRLKGSNHVIIEGRKALVSPKVG